jgi:hypothetical protein
MRDPYATTGWRPGRNVHWEAWSRNGEVCITGLDPPFTGGARLASCLTWLLRSFASHCRRTHDATGALAFTCRSPGLPSVLALLMALSFDVALRDPKLIRERVRRRGGDRVARRWPAFWLEGSVYEYVIGREPFPPVGTPRRKLLLLVEESQAIAPARPSALLPVAACRAWSKGLDAVASVEAADVRDLAVNDEHAFAVNVLVFVHAWPVRPARPRPPLQASFQRHEELVAGVAPAADAKGVAIAWQALWRLPPAMTWSEPGGDAWMRYPAVSIVAAVRPLASKG